MSAGGTVKVAHLVSHPVQYFAPLYRRLSQEPQIDLTVFYCSRQGLESYVDPGFQQMLAWDVPLLEGYRYTFLSNVRRNGRVNGFASLINPGIVRELLAGRFDAIWIHGYNYITHLLAFAAASVSRTPVLYRTESSLVHDRYFQRTLPVRLLKPLFLRTLFRGVDGFLSIGTLNSEFYLAYGAEPSRIFHVPYTVDNRYFVEAVASIAPERERMRAELGIGPDDIVFLFPAKLTPEKAPLELVRAYERVGSDRKALLFVGDGELRAQAEFFVSARGLRGVHFLGFVNQSRLPSVYAMSDVLVRTDGAFKGDWGLTVNEAMACGLAILSNDAVGAAVDLVTHGENGLIFRFRDTEDLAAAMRRLVDDPALCRRMGNRSREIISTWSYEQCVAGILQALRTVVGREQAVRA